MLADFAVAHEDESRIEPIDAVNIDDSTKDINEIPEDYNLNTENSNLIDTINAADLAQVHKEPEPSTIDVNDIKSNKTLRSQIRPGMRVTSYLVEITPNTDDETFNGKLEVRVNIVDTTRDDDVIFYARDLEIDSVVFSLDAGLNYIPALDFEVDTVDGTLKIETGVDALRYTFSIEYRGSLTVVGQALYLGQYDSG